MTLLTEFGDLLIDTIGWEQWAGQDEHTRPMYNIRVDLPARIEYKTKRILMPDTTERVASVMVYIAPTPVIDPRDRITLPDGRQPVIMAIDRLSDETAAYYQGIMAGNYR